MFARVESMGVFALKGFRVTVEVDISRGLPQFELVGLPDSAVKESRDRVRSAIKNLGLEFPVSRITLNLAPADLRKTGPVYGPSGTFGGIVCQWSTGTFTFHQCICRGTILRWRSTPHSRSFKPWQLLPVTMAFITYFCLLPMQQKPLCCQN